MRLWHPLCYPAASLEQGAALAAPQPLHVMEMKPYTNQQAKASITTRKQDQVSIVTE
jgi:hypothetical protein